MDTLKKHLPTLAVAGLAIAAVAFFGGMKYGQAHSFRRGMTGVPGDMGGQRQFGGGQYGGPGGQAGRGVRGGMTGGFTAGEVLSVGEGMFTVKLRDGGSKIVIFPDAAEVMKSVSGEHVDVAVGTQVMVTGDQNGDGSVTAKSVQIRPAGGAMIAPAPIIK